MLALFVLTGCNTGPFAQGSVPQCWSAVPGPAITARSVEVGGIAAISANDIWAVGQQIVNGGASEAGTLTMHWDGSQWKVVPSPNAATGPSSQNHLYAVAGSSAGDVWAVGVYAADGIHFQTLILHWDGSRWAIVPSVSPGRIANSLNDVTAISADDAWAVGNYLVAEDADDHMLTLHWDGRQWNRVDVPRDATHNLLSVRAVASDDVWAAGTQVLHWNGKLWRIEPTPADYSGGYLDGIATAGTSDLWVVGNDGNDSVVIHRDSGGWHTERAPKLADGPYPHDVLALSADDVWAVGEYSDNPVSRQMLLLHWDGKAWETAPNPLPGSDTRLQSITAVGNTLWAAGTQGHDSEAKPLFLKCAR